MIIIPTTEQSSEECRLMHPAPLKFPLVPQQLPVVPRPSTLPITSHCTAHKVPGELGHGVSTFSLRAVMVVDNI